MELQSNKILTYILGGFVLIWLFVSLSFALDTGSVFSWIATTLLCLLAVITFSFKKDHYIDFETRQYVSQNRILWHNWTEEKPLTIFKGIKIVSYSSHSKESKSGHTSYQVVLIFKYATFNEGITARSYQQLKEAQRYAYELEQRTGLALLA
ncbi:hypothetical protein MJO52_09050 [Microbulbifer variabilis]|uniref:Uncharacterized protein n=1 Tax=Microbulbifer variabilis TaxID=266805 RepID=A0ABY4VLF7_9GAMM|nr:hypothetical protein [Microbulbifer variabilis]USD23267.1 hypothetical protein MJO52_09050 [Microbulbifer variabilis]